MIRLFRFALVVALGACEWSAGPGMVELALVGVDGRVPPVTVSETSTERVEILGGTLRGKPNDPDCWFTLVRRTTTTNGLPETADVGGSTTCEWAGDRSASATIDLLLGGRHLYSFARP